MSRWYLLWMGILVSTMGLANPPVKMQSPNAMIALQITIQPDGRLYYAIDSRKQPVMLPSSFRFVLSNPERELEYFTITGIDSSSTDETWAPVWGEESQIRNQYKELRLMLETRSKPAIRVNWVFRVFDDGVGFRYEFPVQPHLNYFVVKTEETQFHLTGDHSTFWIPGDFDSNEFRYNHTKLSEVDAFKAEKDENAIGVVTAFDRKAVQTPLTMKTADGFYLNIHEAGLSNYAGMHLLINPATHTLTSKLTPDPVGNAAYLHAAVSTPWRTIIISREGAGLLRSRMILNLNEPSKVADVSYIKPGKFMGVWWEMFNGKSTWDTASGRHGATTANVKKYIDFASEHGIPRVLVEGWDRGWEDWYGQWKEDVFDFITPYNDYNLPELARYAREKNVQIVMHHETSASATNYERYIDTAFRLMRQMNMNAVKTGYVGKIIPRGEHHDGQWMVRHYVRVVTKAAQYGIMVDAHEPVRPTGLHRTYPNWMACEAARGNEFNGFSRGNLPEHETILPFTRLMGGPMDYTPGIFKMKLTQFDPNKKEAVHTTLAKQLALYVTLYSPFQMVADLPENYAAHLDAFQFIKEVPTDWSETRILEAEPGDYLTIARKEKNGRSWFIGGISDEKARTATFLADFLEPGVTYEATIYRDADNAHFDTNPEAYVIEKKQVDHETVIQVKKAPGGGFAMVLRPKNP